MLLSENPCHIVVFLEDFGTPEQMIRKFCKVCKRERITREYLEQTSEYVPVSEGRRTKSRRARMRRDRDRERQVRRKTSS